MKDAVLETAKILLRTLKLPGLWQRITHRDFIFLYLCMCVRVSFLLHLILNRQKQRGENVSNVTELVLQG